VVSTDSNFNAVIIPRSNSNKFIGILSINLYDLNIKYGSNIRSCRGPDFRMSRRVAIECNPNNIFQKNLNQLRWRNIIHTPYFAAFHRPGWMLRYLLGPFDLQWIELLFSDVWKAWKHSKKDFFVMFTTITVVFLFDTAIGLSIGISLSVIVIWYLIIYLQNLTILDCFHRIGMDTMLK
jgi:hypothetical protein